MYFTVYVRDFQCPVSIVVSNRVRPLCLLGLPVNVILPKLFIYYISMLLYSIPLFLLTRFRYVFLSLLRIFII